MKFSTFDRLAWTDNNITKSGFGNGICCQIIWDGWWSLRLSGETIVNYWILFHFHYEFWRRNCIKRWNLLLFDIKEFFFSIPAKCCFILLGNEKNAFVSKKGLAKLSEKRLKIRVDIFSSHLWAGEFFKIKSEGKALYLHRPCTYIFEHCLAEILCDVLGLATKLVANSTFRNSQLLRSTYIKKFIFINQ